METHVERSSIVQIGHTTTVQLAHDPYTTKAIAGQKRPHQPEHDADGLVVTPGRLPNDFTKPFMSIACRKLKASSICVSSQAGPLSTAVYSQRRLIASTPTPSANPILSLAHPRYGLPTKLVQNFSRLGINSIYPWQSKCILSGKLLNGQGNLVYTAPTGGGKSLVADILMIKKIIENPHKKAILVLPYVALVHEKLRWLRTVVDGVSKMANSSSVQQASIWRKRGDEDSVRVVGLFGGSTCTTTWADMDIAVCTIEKVRHEKK